MTTPNKPNVDFETSEAKPTAEELYSDPAERAVFGRHGGMAGFWRFLIPFGVLLLAAGAFFATVA